MRWAEVGAAVVRVVEIPGLPLQDRLPASRAGKVAWGDESAQLPPKLLMAASIAALRRAYFPRPHRIGGRNLTVPGVTSDSKFFAIDGVRPYRHAARSGEMLAATERYLTIRDVATRLGGRLSDKR